MKKKVAVIGSLSMDLVLRVPRLPGAGETLAGSSYNEFVGGKGNNQALAAARFTEVAMLGQVGADDWGRTILANLKENGVDVSNMMVSGTAASGIANIWVDEKGANSIVIIANSNGTLRPEDLRKSKILDDAAVLLLQLEIPIECVIEAASMARERGVLTILNPAPAPPTGSLPKALLDNIDIIVPNESEAELLTGCKPVEAALILQKQVAKVLITLGAEGALLLDERGEKRFASHRVSVVDTTAAGDAFVGALGAGLAMGLSLDQSIERGCAAGALACTRSGAAPSLPTAADVNRLIERT